MANISRYFSLNRMALALAIGSFTPVAAFPAPCYHTQANFGDIATGIRIGKLLEKAKKNFEKGKLKDLIEDMLNLKSETEALTGKKIDLDTSINQVFNDVRKQGVKIDLKTQNEVKKIIKDKGKRYDYKSFYMAQCLVNEAEYTADEEEASFFRYKGILKQIQSKKGKDDGEEVEIPLKLVVGITGALCGLFIVLVPLPIPGKAQAGTFLITTGIKYAADAVIEAQEKRNK
jgi:hypothetical protein